MAFPLLLPLWFTEGFEYRKQQTNNIKLFYPQPWFGTHLRLLNSSLLEGTCARIMGAVVSVFTPVALVGTAYTGKTPKMRASFFFKLVLNFINTILL